MAIRHGLAGRYGKSEALRRDRRFLRALITFATVGFGLIGFACGYFWSRYTAVVAVPAAVAAAVIVIVVWRRVAEPWMDALAKERIKYLRGGQAEALVAWILQDLDDRWHIFNSVKLERESDIDHILVGPGGLYCISTKSQRGLFAGTRGGLLHNGQTCEFAQEALRSALDLKDRLQVALGKDVPWVQPVLAVPFGFTQADACGGKVWLVHQENTAERLAPEAAPDRLTEQQIERAVKVLEMIQNTAADIFRRPAKEVVTQ